MDLKGVTTGSIDLLTSLVQDLSIKSTNIEDLIEDIWGKLVLLLDPPEIKALTLTSKTLYTLLKRTSSYEWHVQNKPKVCSLLLTLASPLGSSCDDDNIFMAISKVVRTVSKFEYMAFFKEAIDIPISDLFRAKILINAALSQMSRNNMEKAKEALLEARKKALTIPEDDERDLVLLDIAESQTDCRDFNSAIETTKHVHDKSYQTEAYIYAIKGVIEAYSKKVQDFSENILAHIQRAKEWATTLQDVQERNSLIQEIVFLLLSIEKIEEAEKAAQLLSEDYPYKERTLLLVSLESLLQKDENHKIKKVLREKRDNILQQNRSIKDIIDIAAIQELCIDKDYAKDTLKKAKEKIVAGHERRKYKVKNLMKIAYEQIHYGDHKEAKNTFLQVKKIAESTQLKQKRLKKIALAFGKIGDIENVKKSVQRINDAYDKVEVLCSIARFLLESQKKEEAVEVLKEGETLIDTLDEYYKAKWLLKIACIQVQCGNEVDTNLKKVLSIVPLLQNTYRKAEILINALFFLMKIGADSYRIKNVLIEAKKAAYMVPEQYDTFRPHHHKDKVLASLFKKCLHFNDTIAEEVFFSINDSVVKINTLLEAICIGEKERSGHTFLLLSRFTEGVLKKESAIDESV